MFFVAVAFCLNAQNGYTKLLDFNDTTGSGPLGSLISDGIYLYGMTNGGGNVYAGTIFKVKPDGTDFTKLLDFNGANGANPVGSLISDGNYLYGTTKLGGLQNKGVIFKIKPDGTNYTKLFDFYDINGNYPLSLTSDGTYLYGMTYNGGVNNYGTIYKIKSDGSGFTKLFDFNGTNGDHYSSNYYSSSLIIDGTYLYGTANVGGTNHYGVIFKIKIDGTDFTELFSFSGTNGGGSQGSLISDGVYLYGMTYFGGANNNGVIYKIKSDGTGYTKLLDFNGANGSAPAGSLINDGTYLYGMASAGEAGPGGSIGNSVAFKIKPDGTTYGKLHDFDYANGGYTLGSLISDGIYLYGMTAGGGVNNKGVVFKLNKNAVVTGINELKTDKESLKIYPNPTNEILNVDISTSLNVTGMINEKRIEIYVYDVLGNTVIHNSTVKIYNSIDVASLPKGIYFVKVGGEVRKFVKE